MDRGRDAIDQPQTVERDQRLVLAIGKAVAPGAGPKAEQPMRRRAALRRDRLGEARRDRTAPLQRRRGDETAEPLRRRTSPSSTRISIARVTVKRLTPKRAASSGSLSMRSPGAFEAMSSRSQSTS